MEEYVFFIFLQKGKILIEHRTEDSEEPDKWFLPCGGIEDSDREGVDEYRVNAMKREIREEMGDQITITDYSFLTTAESGELMRMYHSYIITNWEGEIPEYSMEHGHKNAVLVWKTVEDAFLEIDSDVARTTVGKLLADIRNGAIET